MNMSFYELYVWLTGLNFPSLFAIWIWLISVPWWLAIITVYFTVFAIRVIWAVTFDFLYWLFDRAFQAGVKLNKWLRIARGHVRTASERGREVRRRLSS